MTSLTLSSSTFEMPRSRSKLFVPANAISTQTYNTPPSENNHLPPLKGSALALKQPAIPAPTTACSA